eukprot:2255977-Pyramimonas_sp.AAC.1
MWAGRFAANRGVVVVVVVLQGRRHRPQGLHSSGKQRQINATEQRRLATHASRQPSTNHPPTRWKKLPLQL